MVRGGSDVCWTSWVTVDLPLLNKTAMIRCEYYVISRETDELEEMTHTAGSSPKKSLTR
jgi:hypothetical protein